MLLSILSAIALLWIGRCMEQKIEDAGLITPDGYGRPIIALEFAENESMVNHIFSLPDSSDTLRKERAANVATSTRYDYGYIVAYTAFLLLFGLQALRIQGGNYRWALVLPLIAAFADVRENLLLMQIFEQVSAGTSNYDGIFGPLKFWMSLKFLSIAAYFLGLWSFLWRANWLGKLELVIAALALWVGIIACFFIPENWAAWFFKLIFLSFVGAFVFGLTYKTQRR